MIPKTLQKLAVPLDGLHPYSKNPRRGDVELIKTSLERHGQYRAIVVRAGSNEILAGNHTWLAAKQLGWKEIAATFVDVDDDQAARIVLIDNRTSDLGRYDGAALAELLEEFDQDLDGTGWTVEEADQIISDVAAQGVPELERPNQFEGRNAAQASLVWGSKEFFVTDDEDARLHAAIDFYLERAEGSTVGFVSWLLGGRNGMEDAA